MIQNTNPMVVAPQSRLVREGFARSDLFVCVHEQFMTETPLPLIEMFDALLSLAPGLSAKKKRKRSLQIMATALKRLEREDA